MKILQRGVLTYLNLLDNSFLMRMLSIFMLSIFTWSVRFPTVFRKLYAEDGKVFLQQTFDVAFPLDFFISNVGYLTIVMRIGGRFLSLFPLELVPLGASLFSALSISFLGAVIYQATTSLISTKVARMAFTFLFCNLPLAPFSAVGNIANTYMYWLIGAVIVIFSRESNDVHRWTHSICNLLASLSNPITILLLPFLTVIRLAKDSTSSNKKRFLLSDKFFFLGTAIQITYIILFSNRPRNPTFPNSVLESAYLVLDRVFGSSFVPLWGHVSGSAMSPEFENTPFADSLWLRATMSAVSILVVLALAYLAFSNSKSADIDGWKFRWSLLAIFVVFYTFSITILYGAEPRYLLVSSCLLLLIVVSVVSLMPCYVGRLFLSYLCIVAITGLTPSAHLSEGKFWSQELAAASIACQGQSFSQEKRVRVEIIPLEGDWSVMIPCRELGNQDSRK